MHVPDRDRTSKSTSHSPPAELISSSLPPSQRDRGHIPSPTQREHAPASAPSQRKQTASDRQFPNAHTALTDCAQHGFPCAVRERLRNQHSSIRAVPIPSPV